jgi:hypothetical protein
MSAAMLAALHDDVETFDTLPIVAKRANRATQAARNRLISGRMRPCGRTSTGTWLFSTKEAEIWIREIKSREAKK